MSTLVRHRPDLDVLADIQQALWRDANIRTLDRDSLAVEVHDGEVVLSGHVASVMHQRRIEDLAAAVRGVTAVHNHTLADAELVTAVAQALATDPRTRRHMIRVGAFHGWIRLNGEVPSAEVRDAAEEIAGRVPGVRGVLDLPRLPGERVGITRRPLQPSVGAAVYASDGPAGQVTHVVINPRNRLVSHIAVQARAELNGRRKSSLVVVPTEAIAVVSPSGVFLTDSLRDLATRPAFHEADFPPAPSDWKPPFPYAVGGVRWPREAVAPPDFQRGE